MDLSGVISALGTGSYTVTRPTASSYTNGRLNAPSTSTFVINASVQPASGRDLQRLPEGQRSSEIKSIFTMTELRLTDVVTIGSSTYQVQHVERWADSGNFFKALALKTGD